MHQQISKKILIYLFIFFSLVTVNNINLSQMSFPKIKDIQINGLNEKENEQIIKSLKKIENENIFSINKYEIIKIINKNEIIEEFAITKNYPSTLKIEIKKAKLLAITKKNDKTYYIGSNGKLIRYSNFNLDLPYLFGKINLEEFLKFKNIIDNSKFDFNNIKNFFYFKSKRWDIETKDGLIIKLPINQTKKSLDILLKLYENNYDLKDVSIIDLRQNNQIILDG